MILLDTDVCVALLRGRRQVLERRRLEPDDTAIAAMTAAELFYGAGKSARPMQNSALVEEFLLTLPIIHTNLSILRLFGQLKVGLEQDGTPLPDADILIAATSLSCCDRLITGNQAHFLRFPDLVVDDWLRG